MCAAVCRSALVVIALLAAGAARAETPMHQKKPVKLLSTVSATYRLVQGDEEIGRERLERRVYDDNTIVFDIESGARMAGATYNFTTRLVLDEESYFPRSFRSDRAVVQAADTMHFTYTVEMFSNVAVVASEIAGRTDSRRIVVPTGLPVVELGAAYSWYQITFWTDLASRDHQRFQFLDPQRMVVEGGEIFVAEERTIEVLGKQTAVTVLKAERERLGPAILYVDEARRIVRCEQNVTIFELVEWIEK